MKKILTVLALLCVVFNAHAFSAVAAHAVVVPHVAVAPHVTSAPHVTATPHMTPTPHIAEPPVHATAPAAHMTEPVHSSTTWGWLFHPRGYVPGAPDCKAATTADCNK